jgi:hypothetical protein
MTATHRLALPELTSRQALLASLEIEGKDLRDRLKALRSLEARLLRELRIGEGQDLGPDERQLPLPGTVEPPPPVDGPIRLDRIPSVIRPTCAWTPPPAESELGLSERAVALLAYCRKQDLLDDEAVRPEALGHLGTVVEVRDAYGELQACGLASLLVDEDDANDGWRLTGKIAEYPTAEELVDTVCRELPLDPDETINFAWLQTKTGLCASLVQPVARGLVELGVLESTDLCLRRVRRVEAVETALRGYIEHRQPQAVSLSEIYQATGLQQDLARWSLAELHAVGVVTPGRKGTYWTAYQGGGAVDVEAIVSDRLSAFFAEPLADIACEVALPLPLVRSCLESMVAGGRAEKNARGYMSTHDMVEEATEQMRPKKAKKSRKKEVPA